jgi:heat shock protein HslJ
MPHRPGCFLPAGLRALAGVVPLLLVAACSVAPGGGAIGGSGGATAGAATLLPADAAAQRLQSRRWELVYWEGKAVPHGDNGEPVILTFRDGRVSGHAGCNRMNAGFEVGPAAGQVRFAGPVTTRMACEPGRMAFEAAFVAALAASTQLEFEGPRMRLRAPGGAAPLEFHEREPQGQ